MTRSRTVRGPVMPKQWFAHYKALLADIKDGLDAELPVQVDAFADIGYKPLPVRTAEDIVNDNRSRMRTSLAGQQQKCVSNTALLCRNDSYSDDGSA